MRQVILCEVFSTTPQPEWTKHLVCNECSFNQHKVCYLYRSANPTAAAVTAANTTEALRPAAAFLISNCGNFIAGT